MLNYILVQWPESQSIFNWKDEYYKYCIPVEDMAIMVPSELYWDYTKNPLKYESENQLGFLGWWLKNQWTT